jgi:hypothetical protein
MDAATRDVDGWLAELVARDPRIDRTLLRIIANVLARRDLAADVYLIISDALEEAAGECVAGGRAVDALPLRLLSNAVASAAPRGSFW